MKFNFGVVFGWFFVVEWAVRLLMLFVVPTKQRRATVHAWLFFIMITPVFGTIAYYMFGNPSLPKLRRRKLEITRNLTKTEINLLQTNQPHLFPSFHGTDYESLAILSTRLGGLPPMSGNQIEVLEGYDTSIAELVKLLQSATEYVHIQYFIFVYDEVTQPVFDALKDAVERGVVVRCMFDRIVSARFRGGFGVKGRLERIGVEVQDMLPLNVIPGKNFTRPDLRNHRKLVVVDGHTAMFGSQNLIQKSYGRKDGLYYEDLVTKLRGPIVWQLNNAFRSDWYAETGDTLKKVVEDNDMPPHAGTSVCQVLPSGPNHEHDNNLKLYTAMVHTAKKSIYIVVPYFIPDASLFDALTTAAQRGVQVVIVNSESIDKVLVGHAQRSYYGELLDVGADVYLYNKPAFLHTKLIIIDEQVAVYGSSNLDMRSFELNFELTAIVYDPHVAQSMTKVVKSYLYRSRKVTKKAWNQRSQRLRVLEKVASLASSVL